MQKLTLEQLKIFQKVYTTALGCWYAGETAVIRGKDLFKDLKDESWFSLLLFSITGRQFTQNQLQLFESIWALCASYPDARIWNNRVAAIISSAGSASWLGVATGVAVSDSCLFGAGPLAAGFDLLQQAKMWIEGGNSLLDFLEERLHSQKIHGISSSTGHNRSAATLPGYGRPIVNRDERIVPLLDKAKSLGFGDGGYVQMIFDIERALYSINRKMSMNISILITALCSEQGLTKTEYLAYMSMCFLAGIVAVAHDVELAPKGVFFPLAADQIIYGGVAKRRLFKISDNP